MGESKSEKGGHLPPFLLKCYNMVDDPISDSVISWSSSFDSFIIWDMTSFQTQLLPKYFKHNNFSSFWRQLNTYGFRKSDPDRWEFVHNGFVKGKKHLLKDISRRKQTEASSQEKEAKQNKVHCVEVGMFGLLEEVETLKRDRNLLMQELVKCRQQQHDGDRELHCLRQRIKGMEKSQQQMFSLLSMAMQNPGFLAQLIQQNRNNWRMADTKKKRRVPVLRQSKENGESEASDGQLVRYQPLTVEASEPLLEPTSDSGSEQSDPSPSGVDDFFMDIDFMSFGEVTPFSTGTDSIPSETNGLYILPDLPEDDIMMEQLLSSSPDSCSSDEMELHNPQNQDNLMVLKSNNRDTKMETYQNPELLTKQTEQLEFTETITIEE